ncbi:hypothetical protein GCM10010435_79390 [Winogradskya consettensis]|uniref:Uncharacterized protein n=1 Tax=Winogradskya consettensis TaxID=113560 RepID=A0A919SUV8_9ACTN|nr:hypothetical protein [Actinoplanes consettensis]GIM77483.1 hypothetical protein Aco04nite_55570 [Actinoplanes consettensis]
MYPGQQQGAPGGAIAITTKYFWLAFLMGLFKPEISFNGQIVAKAWGRTVVPVPAGQHHVHVHVPYLIPSRIGNADQGVTVRPGETVEIEYKAPTIAFLGGALGTPPQKFPGMVATWIMLGVALFIILCACGGSLISIASSGSTSP